MQSIPTVEVVTIVNLGGNRLDSVKVKLLVNKDAVQFVHEDKDPEKCWLRVGGNTFQILHSYAWVKNNL